MSWVAILSIGLALALDAFAVSIAEGITIKHLKWRHALTLGLWFGGFQALMPLLGWVCGAQIRCYVEAIDHWIVFGLLAGLGIKMIREGYVLDDLEKAPRERGLRVLFGLALATSVDALAAGFGFALLDVAIIKPILTIGAITFALSFVGVLIGEKFGHFFEQRIEIAGGLVLILLGVKTLIQHLA